MHYNETFVGSPFPPINSSSDDSLEDKTEDYQNYFVLYCVRVPQCTDYQVIYAVHTHSYGHFLQVGLGLTF